MPRHPGEWYSSSGFCEHYVQSLGLTTSGWRIELPVSHAHLCIVTTTPSKTGLNPLNCITLARLHTAVLPILEINPFTGQWNSQWMKYIGRHLKKKISLRNVEKWQLYKCDQSWFNELRLFVVFVEDCLFDSLWYIYVVTCALCTSVKYIFIEFRFCVFCSFKHHVW